MKALRVISVSVLMVAAVAAPVLIHRRGEVAWRAKSELLQHRSLDSKRLAVENGLLSNIVATARSPQALSPAQLSELLRLRNEVGQLRSMLGESNRLGREIAQLRSGIGELDTEKASGEDSAAALLDSQKELRMARLAKFREWLANNPKETIPELRWLSEDSWLRSADWTRVTDAEYASWVSSQRGNAEAQFASLAFKALKEFAAVNNGGFPTDLSELKPYFETPIEDTILDRYHIVSAKTLPLKILQEAGPDWAITEKAPVNRIDVRIAVGATHYCGTLSPGRWDDLP